MAAQLQALLRRRAQALEAGDPVALAATSAGGQRALDRRAARRARALRLEDVRLTAISRTRARLGYSLAGAGGTFTDTRAIRAVHTAAGWRIASDRAPGGRGRVPWEVGAFRRRSTRHFLLLTPPGVPTGELAADVESGRRRVGEALPGARVPDRLAVFVAASAAQARALTGHIAGVENLAALAEALVRESGPARRVAQVAGQRLVVIWPRFTALGAAGRQRVITHELTHAALAGRTSGRTPAWLIEGVALYASDDDRADQIGGLFAGAQIAGGSGARRAVMRAASLTALAGPDSIAHRAGIAQEAAYAYASTAAFAIAARFSRAGLMRLFYAFGDPSLPGPPGARLQARAIERALHERPSALTAQIRRYALARAG